MSSNTSSNGGLGFSGLLTVLFIGLKLTGHINWPWVWVLAPSWIPLAILCIFSVLACAIALMSDWRH